MTKLSYRITSPFSRINDLLPNLTADQRKVFIEQSVYFDQKSYVDPRLTAKRDNVYTHHIESFFPLSLIYLIVETVGEYPYPFLTEKTWKAIVNQRPFILLGAQGSLALLKDLGFKTFSDWWSEEYDSKSNVGDRIDLIVSQLDQLRSLSVDQLCELEKEMLPIVTYNLSHLQVFKNTDLANIAKSI